VRTGGLYEEEGDEDEEDDHHQKEDDEEGVVERPELEALHQALQGQEEQEEGPAPCNSSADGKGRAACSGSLLGRQPEQAEYRAEHETGSGAGDGSRTRDIQLGRPGHLSATASRSEGRA